MLRLLTVAVVALLAGPASAGWFDAGTVPNKFIVRYNVVPDLTGTFNFYEMPRTVQEARKDNFEQVLAEPAEGTTTWCRKRDHRVCVLFDVQGSVAGIQLSVKQAELDGLTPLNIASIPEWRLTKFLDEDVYSATAYFMPKAVLLAGGRSLVAEDLTAPEGIFIKQTDSQGVETGRLHVSNTEAAVQPTGFTEQACFFGMGKHYFQELRKEGSCDAHRPYFLLFGPETKTLNGFGFVQFGKPSQGRGWFENPPAFVAKKIAPNSPDCQSDWINKYGLFTMHVFFVEKPYLTRC